MPTFRHDKYPDLVLTVPAGTSDGQITQQMKRLEEEHIGDALHARGARNKARQENPLEEFLGPVTPQGQAVSQGRAEVAASTTAEGETTAEVLDAQTAPGAPTGVPPTSGGPAGKIGPPGSTQGSQSPLEEFLGIRRRTRPGVFSGQPGQTLRGGTAEAIENAALLSSLSPIGGAPAAVGKLVRAGTSRILPSVLARLTGAGARATTGAGMMAAPMGVAGAVRGEDPGEAAKKGALMGLLGEAGGAVVGKLAAPFAGKVTKPGLELAETIAPTTTTPGRMTSSWLLDTLENVAGAGLFGGGKMRLAHEAMETAADKALRKFRAGIIGADDPAIDALYKMSRTAPTASGGQLADELVDLRNVVQVAESLVAKDKGRNPAIAELAGHIKDLVTKGVPSGPGPAGYTAAVGRTPGAPPSYLARFEDVTGLLSHLKQFARTKGIDPKKTDIALGAAKQMVKYTHQAAEQAATNAGPAALSAWRTADTVNRVAHAGEWIEDLMQGTVSEASGLVSGKALHRKILHLDPNKTKHIPPDMMADFTKFARVLANAQRESPEGVGRMMIQLKQAAALGQVASVGGAVGYYEGGWSGAGMGAAGAVLGAPWLFSRILSNPTAAKWLTTGLGSPTSRTGAQAIGRLTGYLAGERLASAEDQGAEDLYSTLTP